MRWRHKERASALLVAAAVVLVGASQASAALSPKLTVQSTEATNTTAISYAQGAADDPLARLTFYLPTSAFAPASQLQGDPVGTAKLVGTSAAGAAETLNGTIGAAIASDGIVFNGITSTMAQAWARCLGTPPPGPANTSAYWVMSFTGAETVSIPIFFVSINQDQPFGTQFLAAMNICFPTGFKTTSLDLSLKNAISTTQGWSIWHSLSIPWNGAAQNPAAAVEAESQDRLSWEVKGTARHISKGKNKGMNTVTGKVRQGGAGVADATVEVLSGKKVLATFKTSKGGGFTGRYKSIAKNITFHATSSAQTLPACVQPAFAPRACTSSIVSGVDVKSELVSVKQ